MADIGARGRPSSHDSHPAPGHPTAPRIAGVDGGVASEPSFVGRRHLLAALREDWAAVTSGASRVTWVVGEAGIGKTALVRRFTSDSAHAQTSWVSADEAEQGLRFGVAEQLLRSLGAELGRPIPSSASDVDVGGGLIAALGDAADPRMVVVDDLQWVDPPSLGALRFMLRRLESDGVLIVLVSQPAPWTAIGEGWRRLLEDPRTVRRSAVAGLDAAAVADLAEAIHGKRLDPTAAERLREHTAGHPLHTSVLLRELTFEQVAMPTGVLPAPRSFAEVVLSLVDGLDESSRSLVRAAAVLGSPFDLVTAQGLAGLADVGVALAGAARVGLLTDAGSGRAAFVHPLMRSAVHRALPEAEVRDLHRAAASLTTGLDSLRHRVAAAAGADDVLATDLAAAAEQERSCGNHTAASDLLSNAARLTADPLGRDRYLLRATEALIEGGDQPRAEIHRPIIEACAPIPLRDVVLGMLDTRSGRFDTALTRFDAAVAAAPVGSVDETGDVRSRGLAGMAWARWFSGDIGAAFTAVDEAMRGDVGWGGALCTYVRAMTLIELGRIDEALRRTPPSGVSPVDALAVEGIVRYYADDRTGAAALLDEVVQRGRRGEPAQLLIPALVTLAESTFHLGRWDEASMHAELAVSLAGDTDAFAGLLQALAVATEIRAARGQFADAAAHLEAARALVPVMPAWPVRPRIAVAAASLAIARDDAEALRDAAGSLTSGWVGAQLDELPWWRWRIRAAEAHLVTGSFEDAERTIERLAQVVAEHGYVAALSDLTRLQGLLAVAQGRPDDAEAVFGRDAPTDAAARSPFAAARLAMERGRFFRSRGDDRRAIEDLDAAHAAFVSLGAVPFADRCSAELAACGARVPERVGRIAVDLSPRQEAVALLAADGHSNKEIASKLYISVKGVEYHLGQIYAKTGFRSRRDLAAWIGDHGSR